MTWDKVGIHRRNFHTNYPWFFMTPEGRTMSFETRQKARISLKFFKSQYRELTLATEFENSNSQDSQVQPSPHGEIVDATDLKSVIN